jgi:phosphoribosylformimino-5-aminoimidazole carboxamide ribotide isomerase
VDLYPAIDIRHGRVVRLSQGEATRQTVYGDDPLAVAERFAEDGAVWIHVVDLDRAFGTGHNLAAVRRVVASVGWRVRVQLGGGLRTADLVREGLDQGVSRAVIGTAAAIDPTIVPAALAAAGAERIAVGIDARDGRVAIRGWTETVDLTASALAARVVADGVRTLVVTDVARDGMLTGPDLDGALRLQQETGAAVIASGGVAALDDIRAVRSAGLAGAIVGRALYEGRFHLPEALEAASGATPQP